MALLDIAKDLELIEVEYDGKKAMLTFLDEEQGLIRTVNFNQQSYDSNTKKFVDDPKKEEQVETWCKELFSVTFQTLTDAIGQRKDVYIYDTFNSLFEVAVVDKFTEDMLGEIFTTTIDSIEDNGFKISIKYKWNDKQYESKITYGTYVEKLHKWLVDPQNKIKALDKFQKKFLTTFYKRDELIGQTIMVEVKKAGGKWLYGEIKNLKKK